MKKKGKAQAAMEFLMTYGWAMFVFLGVFSSMVYLDVFNFDQFIMEKCEFSSGIYCIDGTYQDSQVMIVIQNGMVIDMEDIIIQIPECNSNSMEGPTELNSGDQALYNLTCNPIYDSKIKSPILLNYTNSDSGLNHKKIGNLLYKIY